MPVFQIVLKIFLNYNFINGMDDALLYCTARACVYHTIPAATDFFMIASWNEVGVEITTACVLETIERQWSKDFRYV